jgi:hypothetical protein
MPHGKRWVYTRICPNSLSIDRIDPNRGCVRGNVQLITKRAKMAKGDMTLNQFVEFCKRVLATLGLLIVAGFIFNLR